MSEYIQLGDVTYFGITITHPSGGMLVNADETPRYFLYRNASDTPSISANFIQRTGLIGTYRGSGDITSGNGFVAGDYVEVHASGKVSGLQGRAIIKTFVVSDTFNVNVNTWSGVPVAQLNNGNVPANIIALTGVAMGTAINPTMQNAVWGAKLSNLTTNDTTGSGLWRVGLQTVDANIVQESGHLLANERVKALQDAIWNDRLSKYTTNDTTGSGLYRIGIGIIDANTRQWLNQTVVLLDSLPAVMVSGYSTNARPLQSTILGRTLDVSANGNAGIDWANVDNTTNATTLGSTTIGTVETVLDLDVNAIHPGTITSTVMDEFSANLLNTVLDSYTTNRTVGSGLNKICANIYYAGIKFIKDSVNTRDEYLVQWFRNSLPVNSGEVSNPAISIYNTSNGSALSENNILTITSVKNGVLRYNETSNLVVSGEPYLVITSGTIDGSLRIWSNPVGLDYL